INNITNFWVSSSQAKALGIPIGGQGVDGSIGIANTVPAGPDRVATILHEVGHAMGRMTGTSQRLVDGPVYYPQLGSFQFRSQGNPTFLAPGGGSFSLNNGVTSLVNWSFDPASDFADPSNNTAPGPRRLDPYNSTTVYGNILGQLTPVDIQVNNALGF